MARTFEAELVQWDGPTAWHFVTVPPDLAPDFAGAFGRVPVVAVVDGTSWPTSVWRGNDGQWLLAVPKNVRRGKADGDIVQVSVEVDHGRV